MTVVSKLFIYITFLASSSVLSITDRAVTDIEGGQCNGTVSGTLVYGNGEVVKVESNGRDPVSSAVIAQFNFSNLATLTDQERYAGENGIIVQDDGLLFPGGSSDQNVVHLFNFTSKSTSTINVYCQPVSLAYRPDDQRKNVIVGHCKLNTTIMRVPYFVLGVHNGKWTDISPPGLYSDQLDTTNLTNSVILQYESEYDQFATKLYFADSSTLHEIDLGNSGVDTYPLPDGNRIHRIVPAGNSSFPVLRATFYNGNNSGYSHHYFASSLSRFTNLIFHTDNVAYDSFNLDYLVTFVNHKTLSIIRQDGTSQQFPLNITVDDPSQCENMIMGPNVHYLICLTDGGLPVIINVIEPVTSQVIPVVNSRIVQIRLLTKDAFYLLTAERELLFYVVHPAVVCLGRYALRRGIDYVVTSATSNIICSNAVRPDDIHTINSLYLGIIIIIIIVGFIACFRLLLLVLVLLQSIGAVRRASRANEEVTTTHVDDTENIQERDETTQDGGNEEETICNDHDSDEAMIHDDDASTNLLESVQSSRHTVSTGNFIMERDPSAENANNERNNPEEAINDSLPEIEPNPNIIPFESSAKCDDIEMQVFELQSSQPVPFVEAKHVITPVPTTKENQFTPAPSVERTDS